MSLPVSRDWQRWLTSDTPSSLRQAWLGALYGSGCRFLRQRAAVSGSVLIVAAAAAATLAPLIAPHSPFTQDLGHRLLPPDALHWLGTDEFGLDILSRVLWGARITLGIVAITMAVAAPIGLAVGCFAGYFGGWVDQVLTRLTDVFLTLPRLILALAFVAALGPGIENAVLALSLVAWPAYARTARAETLLLRRLDFIAAARLAGATTPRIVLLHLVPLCVPSVITRVSLDMAGVILAAAGLGFLGLGAQPPVPEWGAMVAAGRKYMVDQWWIAAAPGITIAIVSLGFTLLGDGLRDMLDPRQR